MVVFGKYKQLGRAHNTGVMVFFADTSKAVAGKVAADLATFELASTVEI